MDVIEENAAMLSNFEVYSLLTEIQADTTKKQKKTKNQSKGLQNLATITYEAAKYLENTPCKLQTPEIIADFLKALAPFNLTKPEKLQLLNQRPNSPVEIQLLVEESEERLTEDQIQQLLEIISTKLPTDQQDEEQNDDEEEMDATEETVANSVPE